MRAAAGWSQGQLAKKAGLTQPSISGFEKGEIDSPGTKAMTAIIAAFEAEGWFFTPNGIEKKETNTYTIEGEDCYLRLLDIIHDTLKATAGAWLLSGSNERRCSPAVIEKTRAIRDNGIPMRSLIRHGDRYLLGPVDEYRWLPEELFSEGDVKIIFDNCVAYLVTWTDTPKVIVIDDEIIARESRRSFDFVWSQSKTPDKTIADISYDGDG